MIRSVSIKNHFRFKSKTILGGNSSIYFISKSSYPQVKYPYAFGGLKDIKFKHNQLAFNNLTQVFTENVLQGFKDGYRFYLNSLAAKDQKTLNNLCLPILTKNIKSKDVIVLNPQADIQVVCGKFIITFGQNFQRNYVLPPYQAMAKTPGQQNVLYQIIDNNYDTLFDKLNLFKVYKTLKQGHPVLLNYQILFKSKMRLVDAKTGQNIKNQKNIKIQKDEKDEKDEKHEKDEKDVKSIKSTNSNKKGLKNEKSTNNEKDNQIHSVQFQVQPWLSHVVYTVLARRTMAARNQDIDYKQFNRVLKIVLKNNYQWKIGNVDRVIKTVSARLNQL